jgi:hypothetical protein
MGNNYSNLFVCEVHNWISPAVTCPDCTPFSLDFSSIGTSDKMSSLQYEPNHWFKINGVVEINIITGEVILHKAPNEAARNFWQEVRNVAY